MLIWDGTGTRFYEMGVSKGVLYPYNAAASEYGEGVAWNGLTTVSETPDGAEPTDLYADNIKYASFRSAEKFGGTIEAYTYPDEFAACDGSAEVAPGAFIGQQPRSMFGFSYVTNLANDVVSDGLYKLHIVYGATAAPSEKQYETVNDSPDAITFSWEFDTTPVPVPGYKPTALFTLNSNEVAQEKLKAIEDALYGATEAPKLLMPEEIIAILAA